MTYSRAGLTVTVGEPQGWWRTWRVLIILSLAASLAAGCSRPAATPTPVPTPTPTPTPAPTLAGLSPVEVLKHTAKRMREVQSLRAVVNTEVISQGTSIARTMNMEKAKDGTGRAVVTTDSPEGKQRIETVTSPTDVYINVPDSGLLPGVGPGWVRMTTEMPEEMARTFPQALDIDFFHNLFPSEEVSWDLYTVQSLGEKDVNGVRTQHIRVEKNTGAGSLEICVDEQGFSQKLTVEIGAGTESSAKMDIEFSDINEDIVIDLPKEYLEFPVGGLPNSSVPENLATTVAKQLAETGAVMYGAYWCPHCADQKALFGDAFQHVNYVECDAKGEDAKPALCAEKGIRVYPTWEIGGQFYEGVLSLEELARLSGFGPASP